MDHLLSFYLPNNPENQNFQKIKNNNWRYHHFTQVHHKWKSYDVWFLRYETRQTRVFCHFGPFVCPFTPLTTQKIKIFKKWKKAWRYHHLHKCTKKHDHMLYCSWDMVNEGCNCYFSFSAIFCPFIPQQPEKSKF